MVVISTTLLLLALASVVALPTLCGAWARLLGHRSAAGPSVLDRGGSGGPAALLFLVPAHDEEELIGRCLASLRAQRYPANSMRILVVADHCRDRTAAIARAAGALVMERGSGARGKHHAIGWALERLSLGEHAAVVLIDADTVVDPDFAHAIARRSPLESALIQAYDGMSNEFENWLTRLAGLLTRNRWDMVLRWKEAAGLSCPLTGDGSVLGTKVLERFPWCVDTITEGWELYARFTLAGLRVEYAPDARIYAQEARSFGQSASQRHRWTSGRLAVFRRYARSVLRARHLPLLQRLDMVAELSATGPVMRAFLGVSGVTAALALPAAGSPLLLVLFATSIMEPMALSIVSLARHPQPRATLRAFARLPLYAMWRIGIGFRALFASGLDAWVRTARHDEGPNVAEPRNRAHHVR